MKYPFESNFNYKNDTLWLFHFAIKARSSSGK